MCWCHRQTLGEMMHLEAYGQLRLLQLQFRLRAATVFTLQPSLQSNYCSRRRSEQGRAGSKGLKR